MVTIGVLALQGDFKEHMGRLPGSVAVKSVVDLEKCSLLVMPGGESTTIGKLLQITGLDGLIQAKFKSGSLKIWGTCAGAILCAKNVQSENPINSLEIGDYSIARNAYGNQLDSFEADLDFLDFGVKVAFIRAPKIVEQSKDFEVISMFDDSPVFMKNGNLLVSTCHPELYENDRFYEWLQSFASN